jgi:hypothetical protein
VYKSLLKFQPLDSDEMDGSEGATQEILPKSPRETMAVRSPPISKRDMARLYAKNNMLLEEEGL